MQALGKELQKRRSLARSTRVIQEGQAIYEAGEFGTSFFTIVQGEVTLETEGPHASRVKLGRGEFFGEMSLLSGRPRLERAIAGPGCLLVETPRRTMIKLMNSNDELRSGIDWIFVVRELQRSFAPEAPLRALREIGARIPVKRFKAGESLFQEGETGDCLYLVRSGAVTLSRQRGGDVLVAQVRSGQMVGEMALMGDRVRRESALASVATEALEIKLREFLDLTRRRDARLEPLQQQASRHAVDSARLQVRPESGSVMGFLMKEGLGEATNVLVIDESLCIGCDNCEKACAETHAGISRLDRAAGASLREGPHPDLLPPLRAAPLHEGLPAERHPPGRQRRGVHQRHLHRLRQLPDQLPLRRDPHGVRGPEETGAAVLAAVRPGQRPR